MYFFSSPPLLGLDIQPHAIRFVQLRKTKQRFLVEQAGELSLAEDVFFDGKIHLFEAIRQLLQAEVKNRELYGMATAIQIPLNLVHVQLVQIPFGLSPMAIQTEVNMQLKKDFPELSDSLAVDFNVERVGDYANVHIVVTRKAYLAEYVACINATGLMVKIIDVDSYILERLTKMHLTDLQDEQPGMSNDFLLAYGLAMREVPKW